MLNENVNKVAESLNGRLVLLGIGGAIAGGYAVETILKRGALIKDIDVVVYNSTDYDTICDMLTGMNCGYEVSHEYPTAIDPTHYIEWLISTSIDGVPVDFICYKGLQSLNEIMASFDFDVNMACVEPHTNSGYALEGFYMAHNTKVATRNPNRTVGPQRLARMQEKYPDYEFKGL